MPFVKKPAETELESLTDKLKLLEDQIGEHQRELEDLTSGSGDPVVARAIGYPGASAFLKSDAPNALVH